MLLLMLTVWGTSLLKVSVGSTMVGLAEPRSEVEAVTSSVAERVDKGEADAVPPCVGVPPVLAFVLDGEGGAPLSLPETVSVAGKLIERVVSTVEETVSEPLMEVDCPVDAVNDSASVSVASK